MSEDTTIRAKENPMRTTSLHALRMVVSALGVASALTVVADLPAQQAAAPKPAAPKAKVRKTSKTPNLACSWKCDEAMKQCTCTGKDCKACTGNKTKAAGAPMVIGLQTCSRHCNLECTGWIDNHCVEMEKTCRTFCRGG
jgi:hypothetical protein